MVGTPKITVGMPVYNGEKYIAESIESILSQTFADFELLISDNASSDNTEEICREYEKKDKRINYSPNEKNLGAGRNYNILFKKSRAPFFRWQNADDKIAPRAHELCLKALMENNDAVLSYGKTRVIDGEGRALYDYEDNLHLIDTSVHNRFRKFNSNVGMTNAIYGLMRTSAIRRTQLFGNFEASDTIFMGALVMNGTFIEISETLFFRRMHEDASSWEREELERQKDFWDPANVKFHHQLIKQHIAYYEAALKAEIPLVEKIKILEFLIKRSYWEKDDILRDFIYPIKIYFKNTKFL